MIAPDTASAERFHGARSPSVICAAAQSTAYNRPMHSRSSIAAVVVAIAWTLLLVAPARGEGPTSPRLAALSAKVAAKQRGAEEAFWNQVTDEGTPMIEDIHDPKG